MPVPTRSLPAVLVTAALALVLAGCGNSAGSGAAPSTSAAAATGVKLVTAGQLTTCTSLPYEPFQFQRDGTIVGFDVDIVDVVAKKLGVKQQIVETPFDGIQSGAALDSGQCDLGAAAMTITDDRKKNIDFSDPYFNATQALLVKKDSGITDAAQLTGKRLGVQNSTTGQKYAAANIAGATAVVYEDLGLLFNAIQAGEVDAVINDNGPLLDFTTKNPDLTVTKEFDTGEQYGYGVMKGNTALAGAINSAISDAKTDGTYASIYMKWFGKAPAQS